MKLKRILYTLTKYRVIICIVILVSVTLIPNNDQEIQRKKFSLPLYSGDTISCYVMINKSLSTKGDPLGYIFHILEDFEQNQKCTINLTHNKNSRENEWLNLISGERDLLVINSITDSVPDLFLEDLISSIPINENEDVFVSTKQNYQLIQSINYWFTHFSHTEEYDKIYKNFYTRQRYIISPYDAAIKKYAAQIGWDWRLLAAVIYQESKFKMGLISSKGAVGLMQIKEDIAHKYGVDDIYNPSENIKAGALYLGDIQKRYLKKGVDSTNIYKLTLAAYNAGDGRLKDVFRLAAIQGKDTLVWENLAETIPLLREQEYYTHPDLIYGRFNGTETINFVSKILDKYEYYKEKGY